MSLKTLKLPHLIVVGKEISSQRKETPKGARNKGKHRHSKARMERLEKSMMDLENNQTAIYYRFDTLVEFSTKFIHFVATTLYFLQAYKEEDLGKTINTTCSSYGFLAED